MTTSLLRALPLLCLLSGCTAEAPSETAAKPAEEALPVVVATVTAREYQDAIEALGTARAEESVLVTSRVSGRVRAIHFTEGSPVAAGAALVTLEDDEEKAELTSAQASAEQADSRYARMQELAGTGLIPRDTLDEQTDVQKTARARLQLARVRLDQRIVRAPFAGMLGFRQVSLGALVTPGAGIVTLDKVDVIRAEFSIPETRLTQVLPGAALGAESAAYPGRRFEGQVTAIAPRVNETTRAVAVQARIRNTGLLLKPGMLLNVKLTGAARTARFVPEGAIVPENDDQYIWRLAAGDKAEKVKVSLGVRLPGQVEVTSGLNDGDRIVVEGALQLRPGRNVRPAAASATPGG